MVRELKTGVTCVALAIIASLAAFIGGCQLARQDQSQATKAPTDLTGQVAAYEAEQIKKRYRLLLRTSDPEHTMEVVSHGDIALYMEAAAKAYGVPLDVMRSITILESGGNPEAVSSAACCGIAQLAGPTAREMGLNVEVDKYHLLKALQKRVLQAMESPADSREYGILEQQEEDLRYAILNADERFNPLPAFIGMARYLRFLYERFGHQWDWAMAGYHMGPGHLKKVLANFTLANLSVPRWVNGAKIPFNQSDGKPDVPDTKAWSTNQTITWNGLRWARVLMEAEAGKHPTTKQKLDSLEDGSPSYYFRAKAGGELRNLYERDRTGYHKLLAEHNRVYYQRLHGKVAPIVATAKEGWKQKTAEARQSSANPINWVLLVGWVGLLAYHFVVLAAWFFLPWFSPRLRQPEHRRLRRNLAWGWPATLWLIYRAHRDARRLAQGKGSAPPSPRQWWKPPFSRLNQRIRWPKRPRGKPLARWVLEEALYVPYAIVRWLCGYFPIKPKRHPAYLWAEPATWADFWVHSDPGLWFRQWLRKSPRFARIRSRSRLFRRIAKRPLFRR